MNPFGSYWQGFHIISWCDVVLVHSLHYGTLFPDCYLFNALVVLPDTVARGYVSLSNVYLNTSINLLNYLLFNVVSLSISNSTRGPCSQNTVVNWFTTFFISCCQRYARLWFERATVNECQVVPTVIMGDVPHQLLPHIFHLQTSCQPLHWVWVNGLTFLAGLDQRPDVHFCHSRIAFLYKVLCPYDTRMPTLVMHGSNLLVPALFLGCNTGVVTCLNVLLKHVKPPLWYSS